VGLSPEIRRRSDYGQGFFLHRPEAFASLPDAVQQYRLMTMAPAIPR